MWGDLAQYGVAGLSVFLMWRLTNGRMRDLTRVMEEHTTAMRALIAFLKNGK